MKIVGHFLFVDASNVLKNHGIELDASGSIQKIFPHDLSKETAQTEFYSGMIIPHLMNLKHKNGKGLDQLLLEGDLDPKEFADIKNEFVGLIANQSIAELIDNIRILEQLNYNFLELLQLFTITSAQSLPNFDKLGKLEIGRNPGLINVDGLNWENFKTTGQFQFKIISPLKYEAAT